MGIGVRTAEFDQQYYYDGPLGALYQPEQTEFILWAPTALEVKLVRYQTIEWDSPVGQVYSMQQSCKGTWRLQIAGDLHGMAYTYQLTFANGEVREAIDPYTKGAVANGMRSVVIDLSLTNPTQWGKRLQPFGEATDAIIYELHIRDFTIHEQSGVRHKGKFLGVVEEGTYTPSGFPTGLDYLTSLGITHVQFLPMYDYATVDELSNKAQYNWGYDPLNYNVPEGSYSTDPVNPEMRIREMKQMIQALHDKGLRVIMDVVYNHVYEMAQHAFDNTVPGYYFRYDSTGRLADGTECGNDTASERQMMRRYIVDSIIYWAKEFHMDGFRFDLMGNHDIETMNAVREALDQIDTSIIVLGEGWNLNTPLKQSAKAIQMNAYRMPRIAHFNDSMRDSVKGSVFYDEKGAFVNGVKGFESEVLVNVLGGSQLNRQEARYIAPNQVVQYVEAHDNYTLYDKLTLTNPTDDEATRKQRHLLATSIALLSQGIPFLHAGQEFLRTKQGVENSYRSPDCINQFDWIRAEQHQDAIQYVRDLIRFRQVHAIFRQKDYASIQHSCRVIQASKGIVAYEAEGYIVAWNANKKAINLTNIPTGEYEVLIEGLRIQLEKATNFKKIKDVWQLQPLSLTILKRCH